MGLINVLTNVTKAAVAVVATPVALVVDLLTLPASAIDPHRGPFDRTANVVDLVGDCINAAAKPEKD